MKLIADVGFDQSFSFIYSRRPGTPAASLPDDVPDAEKQRGWSACRRASTRRRVRSAQAWSAACSASWWRRLAPRRARAGRAAPRTSAGSTSTVRPALIDRFADVVITEAHAKFAARQAGGRRQRSTSIAERRPLNGAVRVTQRELSFEPRGQRAAGESRAGRWTRTCDRSSSGSASTVRRRGNQVQISGDEPRPSSAPRRCCDGTVRARRPARR